MFVDFFFSFNPNRVMGINGGYFRQSAGYVLTTSCPISHVFPSENAA